MTLRQLRIGLDVVGGPGAGTRELTTIKAQKAPDDAGAFQLLI